MTEKRFWLVPIDYYGEQRFVRDNTLIGEKSLSNKEVVDLLNNYDAKLTEIEEIVKNFDGFWTRIPKGYCSSVNGAYIVMKKMLETIKSIKEEVNDD